MAVTKTHPIKSTLKAAIDYILNPEKTDGKLLASSFGCGLETADIEFAWTREAAGDRGTHLGRHLIQSFAVGETTPEEAHKIGMELAGAVLGGKYEFVLTTHVDKDHLHNHLIFNAVSFVDYKKYHSNKQSYHFIRRTSDRICKEHGLSVVVPGQDKGKSYAEYTAEKQGTSYKAKLKTAIDTLIPQGKIFYTSITSLSHISKSPVFPAAPHGPDFPTRQSPQKHSSCIPVLLSCGLCHRRGLYESRTQGLHRRRRAPPDIDTL